MPSSQAPITPEVLAASTLVEEHDDLLEAPFWCGTCGEPFEVGQQVLSVYAPEFDIGKHRAVETIHLRCYQGEEVRDAD